MRPRSLRFVAALLVFSPVSAPAADVVLPAPRRHAHSANFMVSGPFSPVARRIAEAAERHRREQALLWLGRELPAWPERCPVRVRLVARGCGGHTTFTFDQGNVLRQEMHLEGTLDLAVGDLLAHEVTHTVLAAHFGAPVPRWADEGAAILAESGAARERHEQGVREVLRQPGRAFPLRRLFALSHYPRDVLAFYAQGYAVTRFLVEARGRPTFLKFVADGRDGDWDGAVRAHYGYRDVDDLERAWLAAERARPVLGAAKGKGAVAPVARARPAAPSPARARAKGSAGRGTSSR
jgi:hypothetical protein